MKLCKHGTRLPNIIHIVDPTNLLSSFCGLIGWRSEFFNVTSDQVNCGTCKVMAQNHIIWKLKGENYG